MSEASYRKGSAVLVTGAAWITGEGGEDVVREAGVDAGRLRRMDAFGRAGFLAGSLALRRSGFSRPAVAGGRSGVVVGTAFGCRDSVTQHARLLRSVTRVEDLSPAVFAETVHNSVAGELAIEWRLGGISETLVSGRCAGLDALLVATRRIEESAADVVLAVGAEGWDGVAAGAALVLESADASSGVAPLARILGGLSFFEPSITSAASRLSEFLETSFPGGPHRIVLASFDAEGLADLLPCVSRAALPGETFGAAGPLAVSRELLDGDHGGAFVVVVRDPDGGVAAVALSRVS